MSKLIKVIALTSVVAICFGIAVGCKQKKEKEKSPIKDITLNEKVDESISNSIEFKDYEETRAYDLLEKDNETTIKLIAPAIKYQADAVKVEYHINLVEKDDGRTVLELLGNDFILPKGIKMCEVKWKSFGEYHTVSEKVYRFINLCIMLDGEVYFYEETFYSPIVEGRDQTVEILNKKG